jgi:hypothetical protein
MDKPDVTDANMRRQVMDELLRASPYGYDICDLSRLTGLTEKQVRSAIAALVSLGVVRTRNGHYFTNDAEYGLVSYETAAKELGYLTVGGFSGFLARHQAEITKNDCVWFSKGNGKSVKGITTDTLERLRRIRSEEGKGSYCSQTAKPQGVSFTDKEDEDSVYKLRVFRFLLAERPHPSDLAEILALCGENADQQRRVFISLLERDPIFCSRREVRLSPDVLPMRLVQPGQPARGFNVPAWEVRPVFKGERKNTGVLVNREILDRAAAKAKTEKARTGGSLSSLVELLLWFYVGSPDELLATGPEGEDLDDRTSDNS